MEEQAEKTAGNSRVIGTPFPKGVSGNPKGRPKGSGISITTEIKRKLEEIPEGSIDKRTYLQQLIDKIIEKSIVDGDAKTINQVWDHIDGKPKQSVDLKTTKSISELADMAEENE